MTFRHYINHKKSNIDEYSLVLNGQPTTTDRNYVIALTFKIHSNLKEYRITYIPDFIKTFRDNKIKDPDTKVIIISFKSTKENFAWPEIIKRTLKNCNAFETNMIITILSYQYEDFIDYVQSYVQLNYASKIKDYKRFCDELIKKNHQITPKNQLEEEFLQIENLNEKLELNSQFQNSVPCELINDFNYQTELLEPEEFIEDLYFEEQPYY